MMIECQTLCLKKLLGKWRVREAFNQNSLMQLFNGDRRIVQCSAIDILVSREKCTHCIWKSSLWQDFRRISLKFHPSQFKQRKLFLHISRLKLGSQVFLLLCIMVDGKMIALAATSEIKFVRFVHLPINSCSVCCEEEDVDEVRGTLDQNSRCLLFWTRKNNSSLSKTLRNELCWFSLQLSLTTAEALVAHRAPYQVYHHKKRVCHHHFNQNCHFRRCRYILVSRISIKIIIICNKILSRNSCSESPLRLKWLNIEANSWQTRSELFCRPH